MGGTAYLKHFGAAVRRHRERLKLSQEEFAHQADLDRTYVSGIERGVRNPSLLTIERLTVALGIEASELFATMEEIEEGAALKGGKH